MFNKYFSLLLTIIALGIFSFAVYGKFRIQNKVAGVSTDSSEKIISGIIIPHHDLAKEYIASSLEKISQNQKYSNIVLIGPNHFEPESTQFMSTTDLYDFPISGEKVYKLQKTGLVSLKKETVEKEHSVITPIKYLRGYFPDAVILPLLIPSNFNRKTISEIAVFLSANMPENTLYVCSVDFAHEKMLLEATENNKESEKIIKEFDYEKLYDFKDDHLDSPGSVGLLLNIMQELSSTKWELWQNSHAAFIEEKYDIQGTGYIIGIFYK